MFRPALLPARRPDRRRRTLCALVATALLPVGRASSQATPPVRSPTPSQPEGPFYPKTFPADRDSDLTQVLGRAAKAQGTPLYLSGRVFTRDGKPLGNATVELWQCDVHGRYHHAGDDGVPRDDNFQGYGVATADAEGRYAFKTIRPVPYGGRPPHMHIRVRAGGGQRQPWCLRGPDERVGMCHQDERRAVRGHEGQRRLHGHDADRVA